MAGRVPDAKAQSPQPQVVPVSHLKWTNNWGAGQIGVADEMVYRLSSVLARKDSEHDDSRKNRRRHDGIGRPRYDRVDGHRPGEFRSGVNAARLPTGVCRRSAGLIRISTAVRADAALGAGCVSTQTETAIRTGTSREATGTAIGVSIPD